LGIYVLLICWLALGSLTLVLLLLCPAPHQDTGWFNIHLCCQFHAKTEAML